MNAAEITDKLGLHSLRQRAWVCIRLMNIASETMNDTDNFSSISNRLVLLLEMVFTKVWNG